MKPLLVVDDLGAEASSASGRDLARSTEAARLAGFQLFFVPVDLPAGVEVEDVLANLTPSIHGETALFIGYIPSFERYEKLASAVLGKGYRVLVQPSAHRQMLEMDLASEALGDLSPPFAVITDEAQAEPAVRSLGYPLFLKGSVQSLKHHGLEACTANDPESLVTLVRTLLRKQQHSRGRVVARPLLKLRHVRTSPLGFPLGREYRAVVFQGSVLDIAAYWDGKDSLTELSPAEAREVSDLAANAAMRLMSPLVGVDIGQTEDLRWWVIETNDPQFMGVSHLNPLVVWHRLFEALNARTSQQ